MSKGKESKIRSVSALCAIFQTVDVPVEWEADLGGPKYRVVRKEETVLVRINVRVVKLGMIEDLVEEIEDQVLRIWEGEDAEDWENRKALEEWKEGVGEVIEEALAN